MFFQKYDLYENKLSEQLSDDNPYKKKLIQMETPTNRHPIYTGLVWGLFIYSWLFFIKICYDGSCGYIPCLLIMIFSSLCLYFTYKQDSFERSRKQAFLISVATVVLSILLETPDKGNISFEEALKSLGIFSPITSKSYLSLAIIAFFMVGVSLCYMTSVNKLYAYFCKIQKDKHKNSDVKNLINSCYFFAIISSMLFPYVIYLALNEAEDSFQLKLKLLSLVVFAEGTSYIFHCFSVKRYYSLFEKSKFAKK